ncbi:citrate synthase family protein [Actinoplanes sp. NPDC026619]|uniref:citrate synthase family protein n=1 Tax=Actinoplanes sp. NPDC026619 TaxID=3155798 RepID=UPI0033D3572E
MAANPHLMTTEQVAERLGVKPATVYAYVSRGLLTSRRNADGKGSLFAKPDVDAFVAGRKRPTTPGIQTGLTLIKDGGLYYRGHDACALARTASFEAVATLLWTGELEHADLVPQEELLDLAARVIAPLPPAARGTDRLRVIVAAVAAADPLRFDTTPAAVVATGRTMLVTMASALPRTRIAGKHRAGLAEILWHRLSAAKANYHLLNAALILLADHDLAASTLAARVAASTRAHPYAVVGAGLAALDGPLHGAASSLAHAMLSDALTSGDPVATITGRQRVGPVPGFGHHLYPDGDPRATTLIEMISDGPVRSTATRMIEAMRTRAGIHPNIDFALATLTLTHGMPPDAGETIFAVGRTAGWLAHALEEYADRPSRFRPSGQYSGRQP